MKVYETLENLKKISPVNADIDIEREEAMDEKYGVID